MLFGTGLMVEEQQQEAPYGNDCGTQEVYDNPRLITKKIVKYIKVIDLLQTYVIVNIFGMLYLVFKMEISA